MSSPNLYRCGCVNKTKTTRNGEKDNEEWCGKEESEKSACVIGRECVELPRADRQVKQEKQRVKSGLASTYSVDHASPPAGTLVSRSARFCFCAAKRS